MKPQADYAAYLEECMLLMLTNAAFYINIAQSNPESPFFGLLLNFSKSLEKHAIQIFELHPVKCALHLNPALLNPPTGNMKADLKTAARDTLQAQSRLLFLCAYAPDSSIRQTLFTVLKDLRSIIDFLSATVR